MLGSHMSSSSPSSMPPLSFGMAHSPSPSTSGESAASTPVGGATGGFFHLQLHRQLQQQQHSQHPHQLQPSPQHQQHQHQQFHAGVMAHPRLHLNTMLAVDDGEYYDHRADDGDASPRDGGGALSLSPACSFEAFSLHFHLPLKTAAEKFGVRATAFKKRCRAIGIRHWPYRKVRSLKRSLQELSRCHEQGALNEKQQYQYATFKKQLDKLMAPETYGIDPSGRVTHAHFDDSDDESDGNESCASATPSPRYGATFSDCNISPADGDKTFGDFSTPAHLRALRSKQQQAPAVQFLQPPHFAKALPHFSPELQQVPPHPLHHRLQASKEAAGLYHKFPFAMFDPFPHDASSAAAERAKAGTGMRAHAQQQQQQQSALPSDENNDMGNRGSETAVTAAPHELFGSAGDVKYEDVRPLNDADDEFTDHGGHMDYTNDRFFDDVFLQISPDYGCLV